MDSINVYFLGFVLVALIAEIIWSNTKKKAVFNLKESLGNFGILVGNNLLKPLSLAWKYLVFGWVASFRFFDIPTGVFTIALTFLVTEFAYYWYHRLSHEVPALWTLHHTHHSSIWMNLTTAVRLNWLGNFISPLFYIPLVLIGFSPEIIVTSLAISLFFQFFLHTEAVGKLGFLEGVFFNTPSAHRVHHGSNEKYIDKNYGGMLIIFDRMFGTYQTEEEKVKYGVTTGFLSHNPIVINFSPLLQFLKGSWKREKQRVTEQRVKQSNSKIMMKSKIKIIALIGVLALFASCADDDELVIAETTETGLFDEIIAYDNLQREYLLYIPEVYSGNEPVPLVFSLHGAGGTKESQYDLSQFNLLADRENFILVTPQATSIIGNMTFWNQQNDPNRADDVGFIDVLIDEVASRYNIDVDRVYLAGSSNGAFMALEITCQINDRIAATAAVKGYMSPEQINNCNPSKPTSIIQMHGTEDPLVPYDGVLPTLQYWAEFNQTESQPIVSNLPDIDPNNGSTVVSYLYNKGKNGVEIEHLEVIGGGHDWFGEPGTNFDINASEAAWDFFKQFDINGKR